MTPRNLEERNKFLSVSKNSGTFTWLGTREPRSGRCVILIDLKPISWMKNGIGCIGRPPVSATSESTRLRESGRSYGRAARFSCHLWSSEYENSPSMSSWFSRSAISSSASDTLRLPFQGRAGEGSAQLTGGAAFCLLLAFSQRRTDRSSTPNRNASFACDNSNSWRRNRISPLESLFLVDTSHRPRCALKALNVADSQPTVLEFEAMDEVNAVKSTFGVMVCFSHRMIPSDDGYFRAFVDIECHDHLDFPSVDVSPQFNAEVAMHVSPGSETEIFSSQG